MLNYAQSFDEFASSLGPTDIALYAGAAIVLWVMFKDRLNPVQSLVKELVLKITNLLSKKSVKSPTAPTVVKNSGNKEDVFFQLVSSWKQTRDLAVLNGCDEAVKVADQMFPFLSPNVCKAKEEVA